jgi:hypothetical protein
LTAHSFADGTANAVAAVKAEDPASLNVDRFGFLLYKHRESIRDPFFFLGSNIYEADRKMMILSETLWYEIMVKRLVGIVVEEMKVKRGKQ